MKKNENEMQRVCKYNSKGNFFSHRHSLWTVEFFEANELYFPRISVAFENVEDHLPNFAAMHHKPVTPLQWIVTEADRLSAGVDRVPEDKGSEIGGRDKYKKVRLKRNKAFQTGEPVDVCYLEQTGGIPATNMALLYQCINYFKEKCHPVYISERLGFAVPLNIANKLLLDKKKNLLSHLVKTYNYASMAVHLDELKADEKFILRLSSYAQHRLYFDTLTARTVAKKGIRAFDAAHDKTLFQDLVLELIQIEGGDYKSLISELFHNMRIKYIRQEFVDFLGRLYRFQEAVPRCLIEREFGISTDVDPKTGKQTELDRLLENDNELRAFVASQKMSRGGTIDPKRIGTPRMIALLDFLIEKKGRENLRPISEFFKKTGDLMNIRNKSIIAHGYSGVSEEIITAHYDGDVLEDLETVVTIILEKSGLEIEAEPFEKINAVLLERVKRL